MSEVNPQEQTAPETTAPNLSLQDLLLVAQTIQVCTQRGAFRAEEMSNIGALFDRLVAFLNSTGALKPADAPAEETTGEEPAEPQETEEGL